jgi:lysophospholipase L1-like esterase
MLRSGRFSRVLPVILSLLLLLPVLPVQAAPEGSAYDAMIADSFVGMENNFRLKSVIERAQRGQPVNIAAIGGSVTEGAGSSPNRNGYANQFYESFQESSGNGEPVQFVNAGMAGTPSMLGWIRYPRDVEAKLEGSPDVLIIEFAVNDGDDKTGGAAYESMVRDALSLPNAPAVILLFGVFDTMWNMQDRYIPLGEAYGLPMVSVKNAIEPRIKSGALTKAEFFANNGKDGLHPSNYGHRLMADCLMYIVDKAAGEAKAEADIPLPETPHLKNGDVYQGMVSVFQGSPLPPGLTLNAGGFTDRDGATYSLQYGGSAFPTNWKRNVSSGAPFVIEAEMKNLMLAYKSAGGLGKVDIFVDGVKKTTVNGASGGGWNNAVTVEVFNNAEFAKHKIEIKMAEGDEAKGFTILAFGYTPPAINTADSWARAGIASALEKGFVPDALQGRYNAVVTRAEFCRMAVKWVEYALDQPIDDVVAERGLEERMGHTFSDTDDPAILAAYRLGITAGSSAPEDGKPGLFNPHGQFTREQAAGMIMNACRAIGADISDPPPAGFADGDSVSVYTADGVNFCFANGIMNGDSSNRFNPAYPYSRQQSIVTFDNIDADALPGR